MTDEVVQRVLEEDVLCCRRRGELVEQLLELEVAVPITCSELAPTSSRPPALAQVVQRSAACALVPSEPAEHFSQQCDPSR